MAGIEASTMTSDGTCRLVMPLSESTIARSGPSAMPCSTAFLMASPSGSLSVAARRAPRPSLGLMPAAASCSPYCSKSVGKNACTTWPKMIGSETFIIVALRCTENSTSSALARATCSVRKRRSAATRMTVPSTTSPASTGMDSLRTVSVPSAATCTTVRVSSASRTTDFSLERKSSAPMVATLVRLSLLQAPIEWGWALRVVLDARGGAAIGVALAQDRVDGRALDLVVARAGVLLLVRLRVLRVVGEVVALVLELLDRGLELRDGGGDVGQLDDVGLGLRGQLTQLGERVVEALLVGEAVGELGDDASGEGDVARLDLDTGRPRVGGHDGQERVRRQHRGFVGVGVDDLGHGYDGSW